MQLPWSYLNCFSAHPLSFTMVRNKKNFCWVLSHYIVSHLPHLKTIRNKSQRVWVVSNCLVTHFLGIKTIRGIRQEVWVRLRSSVLIRSGTATIKCNKISNRLILFISLGSTRDGQKISWRGDFKNNYLLLPQILSSDMHQSQYFDGCQEIESSSFIFIF